MTLRIALAGAGAFGEKHLDGLRNIDGVEVTSVIGRMLEPTQAVADKYGIGHVTTDLAESLARDDVDAVILCTPTQLHASQAIQCLEAGKHVQVEIPLADSLADARAVLARQKESGLVCMVGHTRRFNPSLVDPQEDRGRRAQRPADGRPDLFLPPQEHQRKGEARSWTDICCGITPRIRSTCLHIGRPYRRGERDPGTEAPRTRHRDGMSIQLKSETGAICTLCFVQQRRAAWHFLPLHLRHGTYIARYDDLVTGREEPVDVSKVDVSLNGIELQDREFVAAIRNGREPTPVSNKVLPAMKCWAHWSSSWRGDGHSRRGLEELSSRASFRRSSQALRAGRTRIAPGISSGCGAFFPNTLAAWARLPSAISR